MTANAYQIRQCPACGLRYPLMENSAFGTHCPSCLASTDIIATYPLQTENRLAVNSPKLHLDALLDNIRSAWNVGSIFRTADGFGFGHLHLCGITPTPEIDSVKKTSLGAEETVGWTYHKNAVTIAQELKSKGVKLFALEEDTRAIPIQNLKHDFANEKIILIAGNEVTGVDPQLLNLCDEILFIPMCGSKKSFNVAVAFGVAAWALAGLKQIPQRQ
jgi:23S rRNA (guanosine2251-2'-O)-methyltransferase